MITRLMTCLVFAASIAANVVAASLFTENFNVGNKSAI